MHIPFIKYQGTGNDFILVDDRSRIFPDDVTLISHMCNRHFGIGADGLLLLRNSDSSDFEMVYFNADGSPATFCGNGGRCIVAFAQSLELIGYSTSFIAADGMHMAQILEEQGASSEVSLKMKDPEIYEFNDDSCFLNTGTFHFVKFVDDVSQIDVHEEGKRIRNLPKFEPAGTNVNFVQICEGYLKVRTYEKGVEAETLSCGTGVTASAIAASLKSGGTDFQIQTPGGNLKVTFRRDGTRFSEITLQGNVSRVFEGQFSF
ncbi:MAG: diaminopimelate epimerase [Bacteroidales bacterium]|nr:diaminopimelate epimerase [Bacteroidales bacterium]